MNKNPETITNVKVFMVAAIMLLAGAFRAHAAISLETPSSITSEFEFGPELSYIKYEEPDIMEEKGLLYGVFGTYTARFPEKIVLGADARFSFGPLDYDSINTGSVDDIDDFLFEIRGTSGYDLSVLESTRLTPYIGLGYRFLRDELGGKVSTTGALGYDRESSYFYLPIGVQTMSPLSDGWFLGFNIEFDVFLDGQQESELGDFFAGLDTLENNQNDGYGIRGSVKLAKSSEKFDGFIEPFVRYWNIDQSDIKAVTYSGTPVGLVGYEPKNNSIEVGARVGVHF